jgi:hypothetical protein
MLLGGCPRTCFRSATVIPAQAGIQVWRGFLDSRLRGNDVLGLFSDKLLPFHHAALQTLSSRTARIRSTARIGQCLEKAAGCHLTAQQP